jgi:hypothetical protein
MFDLNAPIIPGKSAAGLSIGQEVVPTMVFSHPIKTIALNDQMKIISDCVTLWIKNNKITQIGVSGKYHGRINDVIGIGSSINEVQRVLGQVIEGEEDNLIVPNIPGWCFETEEWHNGLLLEDNFNACISHIFVYSEHP